ncbi:MAG: membrane protein insertase YidC [Bacteroidales bacterium]|nr:membrane protein insertase YidC [Bacteroidales bacterium]
MDKNTVIGFILIAAILFGFTFYQNRQARKAAEWQAQQDSIALAQRIMEVDTVEVIPAVPVVPAVQAVPQEKAIYKDDSLNSLHGGEGEIVTLENEKIVMALTSKGAQPYSVQVKDYRNYDSTDLYILKPDGSDYSVSVYAGEYIQTKDFNFVVAERTDSSVAFRLPFSGGGYIEQLYTIHKGEYRVDNVLSFNGMGNVIPRNVYSVDIDWQLTVPRMEKSYKNESQYSKLDFYQPGDKKPVEMGRGRSNSKNAASRVSWFAFQQQFFSAIMRSKNDFSSGKFAINFVDQDDDSRDLMVCNSEMRQEFTPGQTVALPFEFYFGPSDFKTLKSYDQKYEKIIPLGGSLVGWFTRFVIIPLFDWLSKFISSYGLIILIMTIIIKIVVLPFTYKSFASSAGMQALQPEIAKINARYPNQDDAMKKQQATMNLYKRAGISPMGGCLPTLLTFPILWAMFRFFPASIQLRQQPFLWADDLSAPDSIIEFGARIPLLGDHLSLFALLMAVTMWAYSKLMMNNQTAPNDPNAKSMQFMSVWMMPIMMFFVCNNLSSALSYYYLISQLISMLQIFLIKKFFVHPEKILEKVRATEGKPLPKSKWQQRLEEAQKLQQQQARNGRRR